jgi:hypothetical protein
VNVQEFEHEGVTSLPLYEAPASCIAPSDFKSPLEGLERPQGPLSTPMLPKVLSHVPPSRPSPVAVAAKLPAPRFDGVASVLAMSHPPEGSSQLFVQGSPAVCVTLTQGTGGRVDVHLTCQPRQAASTGGDIEMSEAAPDVLPIHQPQQAASTGDDVEMGEAAARLPNGSSIVGDSGRGPSRASQGPHARATCGGASSLDDPSSGEQGLGGSAAAGQRLSEEGVNGPALHPAGGPTVHTEGLADGNAVHAEGPSDKGAVHVEGASVTSPPVQAARQDVGGAEAQRDVGIKAECSNEEGTARFGSQAGACTKAAHLDALGTGGVGVEDVVDIKEERLDGAESARACECSGPVSTVASKALSGTCSLRSVALEGTDEEAKAKEEEQERLEQAVLDGLGAVADDAEVVAAQKEWLAHPVLRVPEIVVYCKEQDTGLPWKRRMAALRYVF